MYRVPKFKQLYNSKYSRQLSVSQQPVPDYDDDNHDAINSIITVTANKKY